MFVSGSCSSSLPRSATWPLIWVAALMSAAVVGRALLEAAGIGPAYGALLVGCAGLGGGAILNRHAWISGLPSAIAGIMGLALYLAAVLGGDTASASGTVFMALLLSVMVRSVRVGLAVAVLLAGGILLAAWT